MSTSIGNAHGDMTLNNTAWSNLCQLAMMYGWEPAGTEPARWGELTDPHYIHVRDEWDAAWRVARDRGDEPPPYPEIPESAYTWEPPELNWDGNYWTNDGQFVTDEDARNMAAAVERSLDDIPDHYAMDHKTKPIEGYPGLAAITDDDFSPIEFWGGKKGRLQDFIALARAGGFGIS